MQPEPPPEKILDYVPHHLVLTYARLGWLPHFDDIADTHHGQYSIIMEWKCGCPIPYPKRSKANVPRAA